MQTLRDPKLEGYKEPSKAVWRVYQEKEGEIEERSRSEISTPRKIVKEAKLSCFPL